MICKIKFAYKAKMQNESKIILNMSLRTKLN